MVRWREPALRWWLRARRLRQRERHVLLERHLGGPGELALQATDKGLYARADNQHFAPWIALTHGSRYDNQDANTSFDPNGRFTLVNLRGGDVSIQHGGKPISFRRDEHAPDWGYYHIGVIDGPVRGWETLHIAEGSQFPILLLTQSGAGLSLGGQDLGAGGYMASVAGTDFTGAHLEGADFTTLRDRSLAGCNFEGAHLSGAKLSGCRDVNQVSFCKADLSNTDLTGVDHGTTTACNFPGATLVGATLGSEALTPAENRYDRSDFTGAKLDGAKFDGCDLSGAVFGASPQFGRSTTSRTSFVNAKNLPAAKLGLDWSFLDLTGARLTDVPKDLSRLNAKSTLFPTGVDLEGICLEGATLSGAQLYYARLNGADLGGAALDDARLKGARLGGANLSSASLKGAWLIAEEGVNDPDKYEAAQASGAFLLNACLDDARCDGVDFSGVVFATDSALSSQPASAEGATMNRSTFTDATVVDVSFRAAQLSGVNMANATLVASRFPSAQITPTSDTVHSVPTMHDADIRGAQFADVADGVVTNPANMDGLEMAGAVHSTSTGFYVKRFTDYHGKPRELGVSYGPTVLGTTTASTVCPDGANGPCALKSAGQLTGSG